MGDSQQKGLTVNSVPTEYPTVGESPSGTDDQPKSLEDERMIWDEKRAANASDARAALAEGVGEDRDENTDVDPKSTSSASAGAQGVPDSIPTGPHPLESGWAIWEHRAADGQSRSYEQNMAKLVDFSTVEDFWCAWNNVPKPSDIFFDGKTNKKVGDRIIESLSLFKAGIKPEWEDKANRAGGEWFIRKAFTLPYLDDVWQKLVLGMIGETLDNGDEITGARVVDKSTRGKSMYRLELWFRTKNAMDQLKSALQTALNDPKKPFVWEHRPHS